MQIRTMKLGLRTALFLMLTSLPCLGSEARETPMVRAIKRAQAAVVNIHSEKTAVDRDAAYGTASGRKINGMGSGIIIDERGYIVTNQHVVADVDLLRVTLMDGSTYQAHVISYDRMHDLAIIKIDASQPLPVIPLGTSSDLMLGETVIAVGNPFGYEHTVTSGIVSQLHRNVEVNEQQGYKNLIQTDASINPGNSGGPLLNLDGEVVGINVAIRAGAQRIGFAIPIDDARLIIARLLNTRRLSDIYHGLVARDFKKGPERKLLVNATEPDSPAARAGFKPGDVLVQAGNVQIVDQADLERALLGREPGEKVEFKVKRDGTETALTVELARNPGSPTRPRIQSVSQQKQLPSVEDLCWQVLGVKLAAVPETQIRAVQPAYDGGLQVVALRPNGPAEQHGIRTGDIFIGLHRWKTRRKADVKFILTDAPEVSATPRLKYYLIRGHQTLEGYLPLAQKGL